MKEHNIVITGVGRQGVKTLMNVLQNAGEISSYKVYDFMLKGLGQRMGPVYSIVRYGDDVCSSNIGEGEADLVIGLEPLETLRFHKYISERTTVVVSMSKINPQQVNRREEQYPDLKKIISELEGISHKVYTFENAQEIANKINDRTLNILMLGFASHLLEPVFKEKTLEDAIKNVKEKYFESNIKAFRKGRHEFEKKYIIKLD